MAFSFVEYPGNGVQTDFSITFPYISKQHISVFVDNVVTPHEFVNDFLVRVVPAPADETVVQVKRTTPQDELMVVYTDGVVDKALSKNIAQQQVFFISQEMFDLVDLTTINIEGLISTLPTSFEGTSVTSNSIALGSKSFVTQSEKQFQTGVFVIITSDANPANYMHGQVTSYSGVALTVNVTTIGGSGTFTDWTIRTSGAKGAQGIQGIQGIQGEIGPQGEPGLDGGDPAGPDTLRGEASPRSILTNLAANGAPFNYSPPAGFVALIKSITWDDEGATIPLNIQSLTAAQNYHSGNFFFEESLKDFAFLTNATDSPINGLRISRALSSPAQTTAVRIELVEYPDDNFTQSYSMARWPSVGSIITCPANQRLVFGQWIKSAVIGLPVDSYVPRMIADHATPITILVTKDDGPVTSFIAPHTGSVNQNAHLAPGSDLDNLVLDEGETVSVTAGSWTGDIRFIFMRLFI